MKAFRFYVVIAVVAAAAFAPAAFAQSSASTTASANANIIPGISISNTAALNFGDFLQPASSGTATINTAGAQSVTGLTTAGGTINAAAFTVQGAGTKSYNVTFGAPSISISNGSGGTMTVNAFSTNCPCSFPAPAATLTSHTLFVGGTLNVGANQALGAYTGTFSVNVAYP